jgi:hypothetical protein
MPLKTYTPEALKEVLRQHALWLDTRYADKPEGSQANLYSANLSGANLSGANLSGADLSGADLSGANLRSANLRSANLRSANLYSADLSGANLYSANLYSADLSGADLSGADLSGADLSGADLSGANLRSANLSGANLTPPIVPEVGQFDVFKKAKGGILRLRIPEGARRLGGLLGRKCRAEYAAVLEAYPTTAGQTEFVSTHDPKFVYRVGETVRPDSFSDDIRVECAPGIHFFLTRKEAEDY